MLPVDLKCYNTIYRHISNYSTPHSPQETDIFFSWSRSFCPTSPSVSISLAKEQVHPIWWERTIFGGLYCRTKMQTLYALHITKCGDKEDQIRFCCWSNNHNTGDQGIQIGYKYLPILLGMNLFNFHKKFTRKNVASTIKRKTKRIAVLVQNCFFDSRDIESSHIKSWFWNHSTALKGSTSIISWRRINKHTRSGRNWKPSYYYGLVFGEHHDSGGWWCGW